VIARSAMKQHCLLLFSELLPFAFYYRSSKKVRHELDNVLKDPSDISDAVTSAFEKYSTLDKEKLESLLAKEHTRAEALSNKTFKFGSALAVGLTALSFGVALIGDKYGGNGWWVTALIFVGLSFLFIAAGGILGLSAIRVQRTFGYGAAAEVERHGKSDTDLVVILARDLVLQERANIINTMRNEAAFFSFRNGFILLIASILSALTGVLLC